MLSRPGMSNWRKAGRIGELALCRQQEHSYDPQNVLMPSSALENISNLVGEGRVLRRVPKNITRKVLRWFHLTPYK
jgi:hypothetical protein